MIEIPVLVALAMLVGFVALTFCSGTLMERCKRYDAVVAAQRGEIEYQKEVRRIDAESADLSAARIAELEESKNRLHEVAAERFREKVTLFNRVAELEAELAKAKRDPLDNDAMVDYASTHTHDVRPQPTWREPLQVDPVSFDPPKQLFIGGPAYDPAPVAIDVKPMTFTGAGI